jgi:hypothetical protein
LFGFLDSALGQLFLGMVGVTGGELSLAKAYWGCQFFARIFPANQFMLKISVTVEVQRIKPVLSACVWGRD